MFRIVRQSATRKRIRRPGRAKPVQTNAELSTAVERKIYEHIRTVVESDAMNELKDYLDRGRRFAPLDDATLQDLWVTSFKAVVHDERRGMSDVVDANAELTQRQMEAPLDRVRSELELLSKNRVQRRAAAEIIVARLKNSPCTPKRDLN